MDFCPTPVGASAGVLYAVACRLIPSSDRHFPETDHYFPPVFVNYVMQTDICLHWAAVDAEMKVQSAEKPEPSNSFFLFGGEQDHSLANGKLSTPNCDHRKDG